MNALDDQHERRYMIMTKQAIDPNQEIIGIFIENSDLYVLSEKRLFKMLMFSKEAVKE
jgi:hypothetical protein